MDYRMDSMERKAEFICSARAGTCSPCQSSDTIESIKKGTMKMEVAFCLDSEGMLPLDFLKEYSMKRFVQMMNYNSLPSKKLYGLDGGEKEGTRGKFKEEENSRRKGGLISILCWPVYFIRCTLQCKWHGASNE
eukprot:134604_1